MLAKKPKGATAKRQPSSASGLLWMFVGAVLTLMIGVFLYLSPLFDFTPAKTATEPSRQVQPRVNSAADDSDYEFYDILPNQEMATIPDDNPLDSAKVPSTPAFEPDVVIVQPKPDASATSNNEGSASTGSSSQSGAATDTPRSNDGAASGNDEIVIIEENGTYDAPAPSGNQDAAPSTSSSGNEKTAVNIQRSQNPTTYILQINSFGNADEADRRRAQVLMAGIDAKVIKNTTANGAPIYQVVSRPLNNRKAVVGAQQRLQTSGIDSIIVEQRR